MITRYPTVQRMSLSRRIAIVLLLLVTGAMAALYANAANAAGLSGRDKQFLAAAADAGATEIEASRLAQTKASTPAIKTFADTMVTDHAMVSEELKRLAKGKQIAVSDTPSKKHRRQISQLEALEGEKFDRKYTEIIGVAAHKQAVKLFADASKNARDPDVKAFATKNLPALEHHLKMAQDMQAALPAAAAR